MHFAAILTCTYKLVRFHGQRVREISIYGFGYFFCCFLPDICQFTGHSTDPKRQNINIYWLYFCYSSNIGRILLLANEPVVKINFDTFWPISRPLGFAIDFDQTIFSVPSKFSALGSFSHLARKFKMTHF